MLYRKHFLYLILLTYILSPFTSLAVSFDEEFELSEKRFLYLLIKKVQNLKFRIPARNEAVYSIYLEAKRKFGDLTGYAISEYIKRRISHLIPLRNSRKFSPHGFPLLRDNFIALNLGAALFFYGKELWPRKVKARHYSSRIVNIESPNSIPIIVLGPSFFETFNIIQVGYLVHEARHSDCNFLNRKKLSTLGPYEYKTLLYSDCSHPHQICKWGPNKGSLVCDYNMQGAYGVQWIFLRVIESLCLNCSEKEKALARKSTQYIEYAMFNIRKR